MNMRGTDARHNVRSNSPVSQRIAIVGVLPLILLLVSIASAQTFDGTSLGTVTDPNGAVIPGAQITIKSTSTGLERSTTTDENGNYTVPELPIGPYQVRVEHAGFVPSRVENVSVEVASERRIDVKM